MDLIGILKGNNNLNSEITSDIENLNAQLSVSGAEGVENPELASQLLTTAINIGIKILEFVRFWKPKWRTAIDILISILTSWASPDATTTDNNFPPRPVAAENKPVTTIG